MTPISDAAVKRVPERAIAVQQVAAPTFAESARGRHRPQTRSLAGCRRIIRWLCAPWPRFGKRVMTPMTWTRRHRRRTRTSLWRPAARRYASDLHAAAISIAWMSPSKPARSGLDSFSYYRSSRYSRSRSGRQHSRQDEALLGVRSAEHLLTATKGGRYAVRARNRRGRGRR